MRRQNPNLDAALDAYVGGMTWRDIKSKFKIDDVALSRGLKARGIPMRRSQREPIIQAAIAAYDGGESALSIQARTGVLNQTLYYRIKKFGGKLHRSSTTVFCWCCGHALADRRKKTCGKKECMREAGIATHWTDTERLVLEEGIRDRMQVKAIAKKLPARSLVAVEWRVRKTKLEMRKLAVAA